MLKRCNISRLKDYEKEAYLYELFQCTGKRIFKRAHQIQMLMFRLAQSSHFGLCDIIPPSPESRLAFHIYYLKYENTLRAKGLVGTQGE